MNLSNEQVEEIHKLLGSAYRRLTNLLLRDTKAEMEDVLAHAKAELEGIRKIIPKAIGVRSIVRYGEGWYRVKSVWDKGTTVNLCGVFTDHIHHKRVPLADMYEDEVAWHENWTQSETYKSM